LAESKGQKDERVEQDQIWSDSGRRCQHIHGTIGIEGLAYAKGNEGVGIGHWGKERKEDQEDFKLPFLAFFCGLVSNFDQKKTRRVINS
jgi:hypothetical protein